MTRDELLAAMQREAVSSTVAQHKYEGALNRFRAACMEGDGKEAEAARAQVHSLIDVMLDSSACTMMLSRQILET